MNDHKFVNHVGAKECDPQDVSDVLTEIHHAAHCWMLHLSTTGITQELLLGSKRGTGTP